MAKNPTPANVTTMPKTQTELLARLLQESMHVDIPRRLHGAARGLWGHDDGHMVSLSHVAGTMRVRLTGRGRDLAASI